MVQPKNWDAYPDCLPLIIIFTLFAIAIFVFCFKTREKEKPLERRITELALGILFLFTAFLFPPIIPIPMRLLINLLVIVTSGFLLVLLISQDLIVRKLRQANDTDALQKRNELYFNQQFEAAFDDLKHDTARKSLHLISPSVILICIFIGKILSDEVISLTLVIAIGSVFLLLFAFVDIVRLLKFELVPPSITKLFSKAMKKHEIGSFTATFDMVLGLIPAVFFLPLTLVAAIGMISALADAAASIVGKRWGKHKFPSGSKKSVEGYIAGAIVAFFTGYIVILFFGFFFTPPVTINAYFIPLVYATIAALIFFVLDVLSLPIDDNIINPISLGLGFLPVWLSLGIPL
ncbi:MAG: diacylglycerol/polyprenol kinase family protein [Candidatus Helarchaeota archaeon]